MDIEGKLIQKLNIQSGTSARGEWAKQEFVMEYQEGNFPTKACFSVWGQDKVKELENFKPGDDIKVSFNISSREYNGKWYTDLRAWRITSASQQMAATGAAPVPSASQYGHSSTAQNVPAGFTPSGIQQSSVPAPTLDDMPGEDNDDLPF